MAIGHDQYYAFQAAPDQAAGKGPPMHLRFTQSHGNTEHSAMAIRRHADRHQDSGTHQTAALAHPLITDVQKTYPTRISVQSNGASYFVGQI